MADTRPAVELRGVDKEFVKRARRVEALRAIDFTVAPNEFAAVLGPSGCGKSTLLNMVAGFDRPTRGDVLVDGTRVTAPDPRRGVVFQEPALFPWSTVFDNVVFGLKTRGVAAGERPARGGVAGRGRRRCSSRSGCSDSNGTIPPSCPAG